MIRIIKIAAACIIVIGALFLLVNYLITASTRKRAAYVLAEVVASVDGEAGEMAAKALIELKDESVIRALESGLEGDSRGAKMRTVDVLDAIEGDAVRDQLLMALTDLDEVVSTRAALALARRGDYEMLELARERLESDDPEVAGLGFEILGHLEEGFIDRIERELNNDDPEMIPSALRGLIPMVNRGDDKAWRLLKRGITSRFREVRDTSFDAALGLGGDKRSEALMAAVESSDSELRKRALQEMACGEEAATFIDTLKLALNDDDLGVKFAASWGLYKLRDPMPVAHMRLVLNDKDISLHNRIIAARILARLGDPQGADPMYDIMDDIEVSDEIKLEAAEVLGEYREIKGMGHLAEAIKPDRPIEIRLKALALLGIMGDRNASVLLVVMTHDDPDEGVAVRSAYAYVALNEGQGMRLLKRFLRSDSPEVRTIAAVGILTGGDITDIIGEEGYR